MKWENGRMVIECQAVIRVPIDLQVLPIEILKQRYHITPREKETLSYLFCYFTDKDIAAKMNVSVRTVKFHVSSLLKKFNVRSRHGLIRLFDKNPDQREG